SGKAINGNVIRGGEIPGAQQRSMMGDAAGEKIGTHYDAAGLAPVRGGDAAARIADGGKEKQRADNSAGEKRDPQMKRKSHRGGDFPRAERTEREQHPHGKGARGSFSTIGVNPGR